MDILVIRLRLRILHQLSYYSKVGGIVGGPGRTAGLSKISTQATHRIHYMSSPFLILNAITQVETFITGPFVFLNDSGLLISGNTQSSANAISSIQEKKAGEVSNITTRTQAALENLQAQYKTADTVAAASGVITILVLSSVLLLVIFSDSMRLLRYINSLKAQKKVWSNEQAREVETTTNSQPEEIVVNNLEQTEPGLIENASLDSRVISIEAVKKDPAVSIAPLSQEHAAILSVSSEKCFKPRKAKQAISLK